jgi:lipoprotein-releasing system permease protein
MRYELLVALRFLRQGRTQSFLIFGGAAMGVAVIIFLTALLGGLQSSLIDKTLGSQAHVVVKAPELVTRRVRTAAPGESVLAQVERAPQRLRVIDEWAKVDAQLAQVPGVTHTSPVLNGPGFVQRGLAERSVNVFGVIPERFDAIVPLSRKMAAGQYRLGGRDILIGALLAKDLGAQVGDKLRLSSTDGVTEVFEVAGIFELGNQAVNQRWALVSLRAAQALLGLPGGVSQLDVRVAEIFEAEAVAQVIGERTGLAADSWMKTNADLLVGLRGQSSSGNMIAFFVIIAVALGIASVLIVSVVQKSREIGILRATGTTAPMVQRIFLIQGALTGAFASVFGSILGSVLARFFEGLARQPDGSPTFPVALTPTLYAAASATAVVVGLISAWGPARRAARLDPATAIRHE